MTYTDLVGNIKTILDSVSGIGATHNYYRHITDVTDQKTAFVSSSKFHTWLITRSSVESTRYPVKKVLRTQVFDIWGYYAVNDENTAEKTFQGLCDDVLDKFDSIDNISVGSNALLIESTDIIQIDHVVWCDVFCYRAQFRVKVEEISDTTKVIYVMKPDGTSHILTPDGKKITIRVR